MKARDTVLDVLLMKCPSVVLSIIPHKLFVISVLLTASCSPPDAAMVHFKPPQSALTQHERSTNSGSTARCVLQTGFRPPRSTRAA